jgi:HAD superfamily hydrolase (TIGR01509 family)
MTYDTIIFDCDGTLTDSEYLNNKANADLLAELGFPQYTVEYSMENWVGLTMSVIKARIEEAEGVTLPDSFVPDFIARVSEYQKLYLKPIDGVLDAVKELSRNFKTCVASNGERTNVINSLKMINLFDLFGEDKTFTKIQVARAKPAPDLFLFAAAQLGSDPEKCIVIEDSPSGVMAGIAANMYTIGFTGAHHDNAGAGKLKAAGAHEICASWADVVHSINSLTGRPEPVQ